MKPGGIIVENKMFCYQCQETAGCTGCTQSGVCGKKPDVAAMQDLLVYVTKGISAVAVQLRAEGKEVAPAVNHLVTLNLFTTITNANFDKEAIVTRIHATLEVKTGAASQVEHADGAAEAASLDRLRAHVCGQSRPSGVLSTGDEDIRWGAHHLWSQGPICLLQTCQRPAAGDTEVGRSPTGPGRHLDDA